MGPDPAGKGTDREEAAIPGDMEARMRALHRASLRLFSDLSLEGVLERIVRAAKDLSGARYAALGILDEEGGLKTFISEGLSEEVIEQIPHPPEGKGLLGEMLRIRRSIRIPEISQHPASAGFPPGHPVMHSFLGVPVAAYGRPIGQLYLTDKVSATEFSEDDQQLVEMLAAHAAAAIENARLHHRVLESQAELSQRNEELELVNSLSSAAGSTLDAEGLIQVMLGRVIDLFGADAGEVFLREEGRNTFRLALHSGAAPEAFWEIERFKLGEGYIGLVAQRGKALWTSRLAEDARFLRRGVVEAGFKTLVCVPLASRGQTLGVLSLAFLHEREISEREVGLLEAVGAGMGIALENMRLTRQARRLAVLEERERIAMDLHDGIIQSIYAIGLTLESSRLLAAENPEETAERLAQAIRGLNSVIRDIRTYILDLRPTRVPSDDFSKALEALAREFRANTLIEITLQIEPEVALRLDRSATEDLFHIAQEALANVGKHAHATRAWVTVRQVEEDVLLQVIDNGRGFEIDQDLRRLGHGLDNMARRARKIGGSFDVTSSPGEGTTITVRMPAETVLKARRESEVLHASPVKG